MIADHQLENVFFPKIYIQHLLQISVWDCQQPDLHSLTRRREVNSSSYENLYKNNNDPDEVFFSLFLVNEMC